MSEQLVARRVVVTLTLDSTNPWPVNMNDDEISEHVEENLIELIDGGLESGTASVTVDVRPGSVPSE